MSIKGMTTKVTLDYPIEDGGATITTLKIRRPIVNDEIRKADRQKDGMSEVMVETLMFADMASVDHDLITKIELTDYQKLQDAYQAFFPEKQKAAGQTPKK